MTENNWTNEGPRPSRRDFLARSAKVAAIAGLVSSAGCASTRGPKIAVSAGEKPKPITPDRTIGIGLIGIGHRGRMLLEPTLKQKNIRITALADVNPKNQQQALEIIKQATGDKPDVYSGFDDWKNKLLPRDDVDAVISATPCYLHGRIYLDCFAAGKHFYGEKPMVIDANEADALVEAQEKNPEIVAQIGFQRRATKLYAEGVKRIHDGLIGKQVAGRGAFNISWGPIGLPTDTSGDWGDTAHAWPWFGRRKYSGDWMLEQACHSWDVFNWVAGAMPVAASGVGRQDLFRDLDPERDVTDFYYAHLEYPNGLLVDFEHNWFCPKTDRDQRFTGVFDRVAGLKGGIDLGQGMFYPRMGEQGEPASYKPKEQDDTTLSINAFFHSMRTGSPVVSGVINGRMASYAGLLVRKAVDERRWVEMKEIL